MEEGIRHCEKTEAKLWRECLSHMKAPFQRNADLGDYVLAFYCPPAKLAVEVRRAGEADNFRRSEYLRRLGVELLRFSESDVQTMPSGVYHVIEAALAERFS